MLMHCHHYLRLRNVEDILPSDLVQNMNMLTLLEMILLKMEMAISSTLGATSLVMENHPPDADALCMMMMMMHLSSKNLLLTAEQFEPTARAQQREKSALRY